MRLSLNALQELSPESAGALSAYDGPELVLFGPAAADRLSPKTAAFAKFRGKLTLPPSR
jgi:hypothetical protein